MSESAEIEEPSAPRKVLRTVTPGSKTRPDMEMDSIGWALFLGLVVLLVPLLPFIAIVWGLSKALDFLARQRGE
ncbi:hypothetical protein C475_02443 [Halosimplex carlsbadense 2-9-1]|uniref:Uncharacterized protein n=1 Tax=Halosimplex carlsbadense 2-9-1 TaxID=797114 RepID=M0D1T7_9EURY|nr:hypothetical protein [Halosimplex carlsbadense]ELZ29471.1 hypothetical protein C475_02443 [Halosimplex carlsbadense 2-9-1]